MILLDELKQALQLIEQSILVPRFQSEQKAFTYKVVGNDIWRATSVVEPLLNLSITDFSALYEKYDYGLVEAYFSFLYDQEPDRILVKDNYHAACSVLRNSPPSEPVIFGTSTEEEREEEIRILQLFWLKQYNVVDFCFVEPGEIEDNNNHSVYIDLAGKRVYLLFSNDMLHRKRTTNSKLTFLNQKETYLEGGFEALIRQKCELLEQSLPIFI